MRLALLGIYHETNTFSPIHADRELFSAGGVWRGAEIVEAYATSSTTNGGFLVAGAELGVEVIPLMFAFVTPTGPITADAFDRLVGEMIDMLRAQGPWDGVLLNLHGAAVAENFVDADAEIAARVRAEVGAGVPVGAVLDMHANLTQRLLDALTVTLVYQTNPHVDAKQQAIRCTQLIVRAIRGEIQPQQAMMALPLVANIACQDTGEQPMAMLLAKARDIAARAGLLSLSVLEGFPYADVPQLGMSCLAIHDGDLEVARRSAHELAAAVWAQRRELQVTGMSVDEALDAAAAERSGPVVLLDAGDNIGGGSPGDSTVILGAAVRSGQRSFVQVLCDPKSARQCIDVGVGAELSLVIGAWQSHSAGEPVPVHGRVRAVSDGRFEEPTPTHGGFRFFDMGPTAVLDTTAGHTLILTSTAVMSTSCQQLLSVGVVPSAYRIVVAKGVNSPRAGYAPIAARMIVVDTDGITAMDLSRFDYRHRRRPLYPFEDEAFPTSA
ncbi:microcystin degradation protein MlrC [Kribbella aluminosa]|uniref:Microcystin degradation protein MlrC n=1 Tax=Kribbella aluminosa TaxID=416017 RepID=A0ABS4UDF0_9ACTN|nr:M81 family metallopeptidase [Kribbella aluminosa]MBP2349658.1 microcystin degradation protein MlrC [Kribbella aluminosa]